MAALALFVFFAITAGGNGFLTPLGTSGWVDTASEIGVIAIPVAALLIAGEFDLSIGAVVAASSMTTAIATTHYGLPIWLSIAMAIGLGAVVGAINGYITLRTGVGSFIVTLAMLMALTGLTLGFSRLLSGTTSISIESDGLAHALFAGEIGPFSATLGWWLLIGAVATWVLFRTVFGSWVYATGGDLESAKMNGVPVRRVKRTLFICSSMGAALIGVLQTLQFNGADTSRGSSFVFSAIAAAVIGGVLLTGGYGSPIGVSLGAITYGVVSSGIYYTGWSTDWVQLFLGALVLLAVLMNNYFRKLALSSGGS
ncbi:MAG: ABC transporter permease [Actinomycetota bacterium]|nr:ABC transporter permease [Actinomycetota bacterium]